MSVSALDRDCVKHGCAKELLDPKLREFDDCFNGNIRMGDIDGAVERNGHILWCEFKNPGGASDFDNRFKAQIGQAFAFTRNSGKQTFAFVIANTVSMEVLSYRLIWRGRWLGDWRNGSDFKPFLRRWFDRANGSAVRAAE